MDPNTALTELRNAVKRALALQEADTDESQFCDWRTQLGADGWTGDDGCVGTYLNALNHIRMRGLGLA